MLFWLSNLDEHQLQRILIDVAVDFLEELREIALSWFQEIKDFGVIVFLLIEEDPINKNWCSLVILDLNYGFADPFLLILDLVLKIVFSCNLITLKLLSLLVLALFFFQYAEYIISITIIAFRTLFIFIFFLGISNWAFHYIIQLVWEFVGLLLILEILVYIQSLNIRPLHVSVLFILFILSWFNSRIHPKYFWLIINYK